MSLSVDSTYLTGLGSGNATPTVGITTLGTDRIICCWCFSENPVSEGGLVQVDHISDANSLTWARRSRFNWSSAVLSAVFNVELWWAYAAAQISTTDLITCHWNGTPDGSGLASIAVAGAASFTSPFDPNPSLPAFGSVGTGSFTAPAIDINTSATQGVAMGWWGTGSNQATPGPGTGWSQFGHASYAGPPVNWVMIEGIYQVITGPQTALPVLFSGSSTQDYGILADVIYAGTIPAGGSDGPAALALMGF